MDIPVTHTHTPCSESVCVCVCEAGSRSVITRTHLIRPSRYGQGPCCFLRGAAEGSLLRDQHGFLSAGPPRRSSRRRDSLPSPSVQKLEGQSSKMIALCIKHVFIFHLPPSVFFQIRWEKNITLGEPPGFLHSWWWYVFFFSSPPPPPAFGDRSSQRRCQASPGGLKECAGAGRRDSNCRDCRVRRVQVALVSTAVTPSDAGDNRLCYLSCTAHVLDGVSP